MIAFISLPALAASYLPGLPGPSDFDFWHCMTFLCGIGAGGYLLGSIPGRTLLISRSRGIDIRRHGSGNIGATNIGIMGKGWGLLAFLLRSFRSWLAASAGIWVLAHYRVVTHDFSNPCVIKAITWSLAPEYGGIAAAISRILRHSIHVWLRFKGGKGVATSLGVIFGMMPLAALIIFAIWGIVLKASRYVSLASLTASVCLPVVVIGLKSWGPHSGWGSVHGWGNFYFAVAATLLVIRRHTGNIRRLMDGTETSLSGTPKAASAIDPARSPGRDAATSAAGLRHAGIIGAGSWGTALALLLAENRLEITVWGHDPQHIAEVAASRENRAYLPGVTLPETLRFTSDLEALANTDLLLLVTPSKAIREVAARLSTTTLREETVLLSCTKGVEALAADRGRGEILAEFFRRIRSACCPVRAMRKRSRRRAPTALDNWRAETNSRPATATGFFHAVFSRLHE